jgi:16S rRNA (cytosine967-C5)-methyltransferase
LLESQRIASQALAQVLAGRNLNQVLQGLFSRHSRLMPQQRAAAQDLAYGTLRFYGLLDSVLRLLLSKPLQDEALRSLLLVGLYQLEYSKAPSHAVVDHAVKVVEVLKKPWAKGLVNAVLRNFLRRREVLLEQAAASGDVARYSHPQWWIDRLRQQYPTDWQRLLEVDNQHPPMTLRVNLRRGNPEDYLALLQEEGLAAEALGGAAIRLTRPVAVDKLPGFADGLVSVQDAGAQYAACLLDVADGMRVLDACAAPGGKTAHLLESADIELTALDSDAGRLRKIGENLDRLGLQADCVVGDAARPADWWDGRPFQRILADVPCSASGVVRRHPDIKWLRRDEDIARFAGQQDEILEALWRTLERDGKLLYVTCSVFAEENQRQIARFLERQPDARLLPLTGLPAQDGQLLPDAHHDGFFYALLLKT